MLQSLFGIPLADSLFASCTDIFSNLSISPVFLSYQPQFQTPFNIFASFPIDLDADVTLFTVPIESNRAAFVT